MILLKVKEILIEDSALPFILFYSILSQTSNIVGDILNYFLAVVDCDRFNKNCANIQEEKKLTVVKLCS